MKNRQRVKRRVLEDGEKETRKRGTRFAKCERDRGRESSRGINSSEASDEKKETRKETRHVLVAKGRKRRGFI